MKFRLHFNKWDLADTKVVNAWSEEIACRNKADAEQAAKLKAKAYAANTKARIGYFLSKEHEPETLQELWI